MSEVEKTITPTLANSTPATVSNGSDFYTFYLVNLGPYMGIGMTTFVNNTWSQQILVGINSLIPAAAAPMQNSKIEAVNVGGVICVMYYSSNSELIILTSSPNNWSVRAIYNASTTISGFCMYNLDSNLFFITNEGGTLYTNHLENNQITNKTKVNGQSQPGLATNAPAANLNSPLNAFVIGGSYLHIQYADQNAGVVDVYQDTAATWTYTYVHQFKGPGTSVLSISSTEFKGDSYIAISDEFYGEIFIYKFINGKALPWSEAYTWGTSQDYAKGSAPIAAINGGLFSVYRDLNNRMQILYSFDGSNWNLEQLTGSGSKYQPNAPAMNTDPVIGVYNNFVFHAIYGTSTGNVWDVFWAFFWNNTSLFPNLPQLNKSNFEEGSGKRMEQSMLK